MINILRRHRRSTRRGLVAVVAAALLAPLMVAQPAGAGPAIVGTAGDLAAAATTIEDHSVEMPRTPAQRGHRGLPELGYEQRAIVESGNLNIYDSAMKGGNLLRSTPTDLSEPTTGQYDGYFFGWGTTASDNSLAAIALAWAPGSGFFMAGPNGSGLNYLYKLPADGSCAKQSCAAWVKQLPGYGRTLLPPRHHDDRARGRDHRHQAGGRGGPESSGKHSNGGRWPLHA